MVNFDMWNDIMCATDLLSRLSFGVAWEYFGKKYYDKAGMNSTNLVFPTAIHSLLYQYELDIQYLNKVKVFPENCILFPVFAVGKVCTKSTSDYCHDQ